MEFVEKKKKCFLVRKCAHWADGLKVLCSSHFVFGGLMVLLQGGSLGTEIHGKGRACEWFTMTNALFSGSI